MRRRCRFRGVGVVDVDDVRPGELIRPGGYPEALKRRDLERRRAWFGSYITTILQRDVRDMASIERLSEFPQLLRLLAARCGTLLNFAELTGQTPVLTCRTRNHQKVSAIGGISLSPRVRKPNLYMHLHPASNIGGEEVVVFLRHLLRHLRGNVTVIWDNIKSHRSALVKAHIRSQPRLRVVP